MVVSFALPNAQHNLTVQPKPNEPFFWWKSAPGTINIVGAWVQHENDTGMTKRKHFPPEALSPALKVRGKLLACVPSHRSAEPGSLVVRIDFDNRAELLAADPDVYYVTDHYLNYTSVLVRLSRVSPDVLRDLLGMAHKFVTARRAR
jgi:hypothetical protein